MRTDQDLRARAIERCRRLLGQDEDLQRAAPSPAARARLLAEGTSSLRCLTLACELYADRPCFGERAFVIEGGTARPLPALRTLTYAELWARIQALAGGLRAAGLVEEGAFVGVCGFASVDWVVTDLACLYLAAVSVPLPTAATAAELRPLVHEAGLSCVVCSPDQLERVAAAVAGAPSVKSLVVMDVREGDRAAAEALALGKQRIEEERGSGIAVWTIAEVERLGRERGPAPPVEGVPGDALRTIVYTSGSTGSPKGAMFPERLWAQLWQAPWPGELAGVPYVSVDYMPLNHLAGRGTVLRSLMLGGLTSFVLAPDMSTLFEDIRIARPTALFLVPRTASMIHQRFLSEVVKRPGAAAEVMDEMRRTFLGDRLILVQTGTAPTPPEVAAFLERCFDVPVIDGYGSTEANLIAIDGRIAAENVVAYKLTDVPDLGYRGSDRPYPRGELCIRARRVIPGYYRNPEATAELFDEEGYLRTGDIVEQRGPGEVAVVDRKKNVLKLAQGEFVSVSRLEQIYGSGSPFIRQVIIYGSSLRAYPLAVVVPAGTVDKAVLAGEIHRIAAREGLRAWEIPRDFLVEPQPFTRENGLLTESNKPSRPRLRERYGERLEQLYAAIERSQIEDLYAIERGRGDARPVAEKVARALAVTLGVAEIDEGTMDEPFAALGGDSLGAVRLAALLEDVCGVAVPVGKILDPTATIRALVRDLTAQLAGKSAAPRVTFADVHGARAETVEAGDLSLDRFVGAGEIAAAEPAPGAARVALLTGANGFLGRFLLLELLERLPPGGKVVALVRAPRGDDAAARERLAAAYAGVDPTLPARFAALSAGGRLEVLAGDLIAPRLALSDPVWDRLAAEVDVLLHNGALVNHAFSYPQLFEPNVLGTVEVIRLALRRRRARVAFVSTVGVADGVERDEPIREDEDAASLSPRRPVDSGVAVGYATSKWAGEILLRDLQGRTGAPVAVFRCSVILPPRSFVGQVNAGDFLTRLLHSVVVTGLAPRSFYAGVARPQLDGLPADFVARAIATIALDAQPGYAISHVVAGRRGEDVSLDTLVDWVDQAGYHVTRIDDHDAWLRAFRERLEALSPAEQQRSALPMLKMWERPLRRVVAFDNRGLRARLAALIPGAPAEVPRIDPLFVQQYLKNMIYAGLIPHPDLTAAA